MGFGVVVEIDVQILSRPDLLFHPPAPAPQCRFRIAASILLPRPVEADVCERPDGQARDIQPGHVVSAEGDPALLQQLKDLVDHPTLIAEFEDVPQVSGQQVQEGLQSLQVQTPARRQLIEDRAQMFPQEPGPIQKSLERRFRVFQPLQMGQVSIRFDRVNESVRRLLAPCLEGLGGGQLVESIVDLDRVESLSVELEPLLRRRSFRIEAPAPMVVIPARASDVNLVFSHGLRIASIIGLIGPIGPISPIIPIDMHFDELTKYFERLEAASGRLKIYKLLGELFSRAGEDEIAEIAYLLEARLGPPFAAVNIGMGERMVAAAVAAATKKAEAAVTKLYKELGDLGLVAQSLTPKNRRGKLTVSEVYSSLLEIARTSGRGSAEKKVALLGGLIGSASPVSALYIARLGVGAPTIIEAVSRSHTKSKEARAVIERAYNLCSDLGLTLKSMRARGLA